MSVLANAYYIARHNLSRQMRSPALGLFLLAGILSPFLLNWNETSATLNFLGMDLDTVFTAGRIWALHYAFYDLYRCNWLLVVFFVFNWVLMPLTSSYTVSQSLWLRLSGASYVALALSRILQALFAALLILLVSLVWVVVFALRHGLNFGDLMPPIYGLLAYVIFSSGLIIIMFGKPTTRMTRRTAYVVLAFSIPILLYVIGKNLEVIHWSNGYFPYTVPVGWSDQNNEVIRAYESAGIIGGSLMLISIIRAQLMPLTKLLRYE